MQISKGEREREGWKEVYSGLTTLLMSTFLLVLIKLEGFIIKQGFQIKALNLLYSKGHLTISLLSNS